MKTTTISQGQRYKLDSLGNGWAYTLRDLLTKQSVWFQDDDAKQFRVELDELEERFPKHSPDQLLALMWEDYGLLASDDAAD